jgi:threonine aldolase
MRRAMHDAEVGNDLYGEDPTVRRLEDRTAEILGKDASLLVLTATMGNILSVLAQTRVPRPIRRDAFDEAALQATVLLSLSHHTPSKLLCIENTHNALGGRCLTMEQTKQYSDAAKSHGLRVHLDGARLFNAAVALKQLWVSQKD